MTVTAQTVENISVGAGEIYYRQDNAVAWEGSGATMENNVWRVERDYFAPKINGVLSLLKGTDYLQEERCFMEFSPAEVSADILGLVVPGSVSTVETSAVVGGGAATTLADATIAGQYLAIKVASVASMTVGDFISIGVTPFIEKRKITRVGTALIGGTGIDVEFPLIAPHASGQAVTEIDGLGGTVIEGGAERRLPTSAYHDYRLDVPGLDGRMTRFFLFNAIASDDAEFEAADDDAMHPRLVLAGRRSASTPEDSAWQIRKEAAFV